MRFFMNENNGQRLAKRIARAGVASRRDAEKLILAGDVTLNGEVIKTPAINVLESDLITVRGEALKAEEPVRLWRYHKPNGLVTSDRDEKGRDTIYDKLPADLPRVMSVGRLDINSEGLLLLTNDGGLKRQLELPSTGWLRRYRVRVKGRPTDAMLEPLTKGITVDGERFQGMQVSVDRQQGANAWLTIGLREGKNREVRRALSSVGLDVNRLIRVSYGPFQLKELAKGEVEEVPAKTIRDQIAGGRKDAGDAAEPAKKWAQKRVKPTKPPRKKGFNPHNVSQSARGKVRGKGAKPK